MEIKTFSEQYRNALRSIYLESRKSTFTWLETSTYQLLDFDQDTEAERIHVALEGDDVLGFISVWEPDNLLRNDQSSIKVSSFRRHQLKQTHGYLAIGGISSLL